MKESVKFFLQVATEEIHEEKYNGAEGGVMIARKIFFRQKVAVKKFVKMKKFFVKFDKFGTNYENHLL